MNIGTVYVVTKLLLLLPLLGNLRNHQLYQKPSQTCGFAPGPPPECCGPILHAALVGTNFLHLTFFASADYFMYQSVVFFIRRTFAAEFPQNPTFLP